MCDNLILVQSIILYYLFFLMSMCTAAVATKFQKLDVLFYIVYNDKFIAAISGKKRFAHRNHKTNSLNGSMP